MAVFLYKAQNAQGNVFEGELEAGSKDEAEGLLRRKRLIVQSVKKKPMDIKINIGSLHKQGEDMSMPVLGRDVKTGMPRELTLSSSDIYEVLFRLARQIADEVLSVLENTSPELVSDVARNGIILTGGGSQLRGLDELLSERTGVRCSVADDPGSCVVYGCGKSLAWINKMREGPINIARKRILKG